MRPIVGQQSGLAQAVKSWLGLLVLCLYGICAHAQDSTSPKGEDVYQQGLGYLARSDLFQAKLLMEKAVELNPNNAGAWLDLSLIHCQLGDVDRANQIWDEIEARFSPPSSLRAVINQGRSRGCLQESATREVELEVARGHTSNMNQGVSSLSLELPSAVGPVPVQLLPQYGKTPDAYTQISGALRLASPGAGANAQLSFQQRENDQLKSLNVLSVGLDASMPQHTELGRLDWGAGLAQATLGGSPFQRSTRLRLGLRPRAQPLPGWDLILGVAASQVDYTAYENMSARPRDLQLSLTREWVGSRLEVYAQHSTDSAKETRPGGDKSGNRLGFNLLQVMGMLRDQNVFFKFAWDAQSWRGSQAYSPGLIDEARNQLISTTSVAFLLPQSKTELWSLEARHQRNQENVKLFEYEAMSLQLSYRKTWGY